MKNYKVKILKNIARNIQILFNMKIKNLSKNEKLRFEQIMKEIAHLKGASKRKPITEGEYEKAREQAFEKISKELDF